MKSRFPKVNRDKSPEYKPKLLAELIDFSSDEDGEFVGNWNFSDFSSNTKKNVKRGVEENPKSSAVGNSRQENSQSNFQNSKFSSNSINSQINRSKEREKSISSKKQEREKYLQQKSISPNKIKYDSFRINDTDTERQNQLFAIKRRQQFEHQFSQSTVKDDLAKNQKGPQASLKDIQQIDSLDNLRAHKRFEQVSMDTMGEGSQKNFVSGGSNGSYCNMTAELEIEMLKAQLKRTKDIVKTLSLKNSDLQSDIQRLNVKLKQQQSGYSSNGTMDRFGPQQGLINKKMNSAIDKTYEGVIKYLKTKVTELTVQLQSTKMNPAVENVLENFLAEILQINRVSVEGVMSDDQRLNQQKWKQPNQQELQQNYSQQKDLQPHTPNRREFLENSHSKLTPNSNAQPNASVSNQRQNRMMNSFCHQKNKENVTPNKHENEFKQLEKSLNKLRNMEKELCTPYASRRNNYATENPSEEYCERSFVGNRSLLVVGENQSINVDRSKSKRKKIFG